MVPVIQISNRHTIRAASDEAFADARTRFTRHGYLMLAAVIEPGFLREVTEALDRAEFYTRLHEGIGSELCASPSPLTGALELAFNDPVLFGLVNELAPAAELEALAFDFALKLASKSPLTLAIGKEAFYKQAELPLSGAYEYTREVMAKNLQAQDAQEGNLWGWFLPTGGST